MIIYLIGDATCPVQKPAIIAHICNNMGGWGAGFVLALSRKWKEPERDYRSQSEYFLGSVRFVAVEENVIVANMIAQDRFGGVAVDYPSLRTCLNKVKRTVLQQQFVLKSPFSVHMPRIGCGLGGGDWETVSKIVEEELDGVEVFVYDLKGR